MQQPRAILLNKILFSMGRAQSLVANGCLFPGPLLSQSPALSKLGLGCILAACFFLKKKKKVCVCVFYFYFIFLICTPWKIGCSDPRPWRGEHRAPLPKRKRDRAGSQGAGSGDGVQAITLCKSKQFSRGARGRRKKRSKEMPPTWGEEDYGL